MKTSALIVEFVTVGFQVLFWLFPLLLMAGYSIEISSDAVKDISLPLSFCILAIAYSLGLIVDALSAYVEGLLPTNLWNKCIGPPRT